MDQARLILGAILWTTLVVVVTFDPGWHRSAVDNGDPDGDGEYWHRFSERCASTSLKTLPEAEEEFPADPASNHVAEVHRGPECDGGVDCAANVLARSEDGWTADVASLYATSDPEVIYTIPSVAGRYRMTSATLLMPDTGHALRVIEFSPASAKEEEGWTPEVLAPRP